MTSLVPRTNTDARLQGGQGTKIVQLFQAYGQMIKAHMLE